MKILLVYNNFAGNGRAKKNLPQVESLFKKYKINFDIAITKYSGHGIEIVGNADLSKYDGIVAAGGDGTLFEVINGYFKNSSEQTIPLGVLPVGTGNAFARDLELDTTKIEEAIEIISKQKLRKVDVGKFSTEGKDYYFLNIIGAGFVADANKTAQSFKIFGNFSYIIGVFYRILVLKFTKLKLEFDGKKLETESTFIEVSNTRYTGADFLMAPNAEIDDGLLDITLVKKISRLKLLQTFPKIFTGEHILINEIETHKAKHIKIETDKPLILTPDGELLGTTPVEIECLKHAIEVFWK
ncbi:MAG: diacylglycerol kinase family lipid kinase [Melioribacteraceae bacterium]|nr:diacylglycerol kinase family lipid kinase [Melioribacteraceae bacterium]